VVEIEVTMIGNERYSSRFEKAMEEIVGRQTNVEGSDDLLGWDDS
jgi:hypothetical protein